MRIEDVREARRMVDRKESFWSWVKDTKPQLWTSYVLGYIVMLLPAVLIALWWDVNNTYIILGVAIVLLIPIFHIYHAYIKEREETKTSAYLVWIQDYVKPYIDEIPTEKCQLEGFFVSDAGMYYYPRNKDVRNVIAAFIRPNSTGIDIRSMLATIYIDLPGNEAPYITFKEVTDDIGPGFEKGFYYAEIHVGDEQVDLLLKKKWMFNLEKVQISANSI